MNKQESLLRVAAGIALFLFCLDATAQTRTLRPDDLFQLRRVGTVAWSPNGQYAVIEFSKPSRWLGDLVPSNDLWLLDVKTRTLRLLSPKSSAYVGFFNSVWSPDSKRVAFLSIDTGAVVRAWVWTVGTATAAIVPKVEPPGDFNDPGIAWIDGDRLAVMSLEAGAKRAGLLYVRVLRGRNVAAAWEQALEGRSATVSVVDSKASETDAPGVELVTVDLRTGSRKRLARGSIHSLSTDPDGCCVSFLRKNREPVASYFETAERAGDVDAGYTAVNWGTERHTLDARSGEKVEKTIAKPPQSPPRPQLPPPPEPGARVLSMSPKNDAALYLSNGPSGSQMWLAGGAARPLTSHLKIWQANEWMKDVKVGRAERITYKAMDGTALNAWILLPPGHVSGTRVPVVTSVYPGSVYNANEPSSFSPYRVHFEHSQLFAALGYAVLLPSMPVPKNQNESHALAPLLNGVIPALDAAIAQGIADPDRIAVLGQSDGGFAALGLITQTARFRSAIASASFSNLTSLYGTFYGQYRYGDSGRPEAAQILRMLQTEKGLMSMGGPPWKEPDRYRETSAIHRVDKVVTPLMIIHGELDFIPIQQAEEFFTALYRQDKRVTLLRYAGEGHTISDRANVLDMWQRIEKWLADTMK